MKSPSLPPQIRVFVRDWLSSNNVVLKSPNGHVVIDSGYAKHVPLTLALIASRQGLDGGGLAKLVNTHCHSDHMGGNAALARAYGCPIAVPEAEAEVIDAWDQEKLLLNYAGQHADRFPVGEVLRAGSTHLWGDLEWRALAAPGHDMRALVFYNPEHGILISGDALWQNGYGIVMPPEIDPEALPATRATLEMLAELDIRVVIPGHGEPFTEVAIALERAFSRTRAFEADSQRVARHALKVLLTFHLLDRERLRIADVPARLDAIGICRDLNAACLELAPEPLADMLLSDLQRADVIRRDGEFIVPAR
jgi:glyoxylase-like metal-dependent hydrolase (beta-lactamase superfamily II)